MSVNHSYFSLDWSRVPDVNNHKDFDFLFELIEEEAMPDWIGDVPFGSQVDNYLFSSWSGFMSFKDWFMEARDWMDHGLVSNFTSLYQDVGLLMDDSYSYVPIKKDITIQDDWILGAIPPSDVKSLLERCQKIDVSSIASEFQKALDRKPLDLFVSGKTVRDWVTALHDGLSAVSEKNFGILIGAA